MVHIPFLSHYLERKNIEYQNQLLARQVEEVQNIYLTMRGWRHDYHNHLQSMKAYVEMGQYDKLQEYLGLLENDLDQVNQLCDSGNVNLDAYFKFQNFTRRKERHPRGLQGSLPGQSYGE